MSSGWKKPGGPQNGPPRPKKPRADFDDDDEGGDFEDRLAMMLDEEDDVGPVSGVPEEEEAAQDLQTERLIKWKRPEPSPELFKSNLVFQQIDIDHYIGAHMDGMPGKYLLIGHL